MLIITYLINPFYVNFYLSKDILSRLNLLICTIKNTMKSNLSEINGYIVKTQNGNVHEVNFNTQFKLYLLCKI